MTFLYSLTSCPPPHITVKLPKETGNTEKKEAGMDSPDGQGRRDTMPVTMCILGTTELSTILTGADMSTWKVGTGGSRRVSHLSCSMWI